MTVKGNFDSRQGKESAFEGDTGAPAHRGGIAHAGNQVPQYLQPVVDLLELLAQLSQGDYALRCGAA